jgi:hypothetical protein
VAQGGGTEVSEADAALSVIEHMIARTVGERATAS